MITAIEKRGYTHDRYGNYKKDTDKGMFRFKFNETSFRHEKRIDTSPPSWMRISGGYYKNVKILND
jgi:hypothetical protein